MPGHRWTADSDAKLFTCFIKVHKTKIDYAALKTEMDHIGITDLSVRAIQERILKIKKTSGGGTPSRSNVSTPLSSSRKRANPMTPRGRSRPRSAKKNAAFQGDEEEDDAALSGAESEEELVKSYSDKESGDDAETPSKDRSSLRRSVTVKPRGYAGFDEIDDDEEEEMVERPVKKTKLQQLLDVKKEA